VLGVEIKPQSLAGIDVSFGPPIGVKFPAFAQRTGFFDTTYVVSTPLHELYDVRTAL
jgi:hypothetical protein